MVADSGQAEGLRFGMPNTNLRQIVERLGAHVAFLPNAPSEEFRHPRMVGHLHVLALSLSEDEEQHWVRGWQFSLMDRENNLVEQRYLDADELSQLQKLLRKASDDSVAIGYEYHSNEGVIFKKFTRN